MDGILATVKSSQISVEDAINVFVDGLKDPFKPRFCGECLVGCLLIIYPSVTGTQDIRANHSFWSTAISFLTVDRPPGSIDALDRHLSQCNCRVDSDRIVDMLHLLTRSIVKFSSKLGPSGSLGAIIAQLNNAFAHIMKPVKSFKVAKGRHTEIWPSSPHDLMPHGQKFLFLLAPFCFLFC